MIKKKRNKVINMINVLDGVSDYADTMRASGIYTYTRVFRNSSANG